MKFFIIMLLACFAFAGDTYDLKLKLSEGKKYVATYKGKFVTEDREKRGDLPEELKLRQVLNFELTSTWEIKNASDKEGAVVDELPDEVFLKWELQNGGITLRHKDGKFIQEEYTGGDLVKRQMDDAKASISERKTVRRTIKPNGAVIDPNPTSDTTINMPAFLPDKPVKEGENWQIKDGEATLNCKLVRVEKVGEKTHARIRATYSYSGKTNDREDKLERDVTVMFCVEDGMFTSYAEKYVAASEGDYLGAVIKSALTANIEVTFKPK